MGSDWCYWRCQHYYDVLGMLLGYLAFRCWTNISCSSDCELGKRTSILLHVSIKRILFGFFDFGSKFLLVFEGMLRKVLVMLDRVIGLAKVGFLPVQDPEVLAWL